MATHVTNLTDKSIRVPKEHYAVLRKIAEAEQRTLRAVFYRCVSMYARKHLPEVLKEVA
jgi:hypothetical protein